MNTIFMTDVEVYEKGLEKTIRTEDANGPRYIPIAKTGAGLSLIQMKHNTKINHLTGEVIPRENGRDETELLVFFYQLEEDRKMIEENVDRRITRTNRKGKKHGKKKNK